MTVFQHIVLILVVSIASSVGAVMLYERAKTECVVSKAETSAQLSQAIDYTQYDW